LVSTAKLTDVGAASILHCTASTLHTLSMSFNTRVPAWAFIAEDPRINPGMIVDLDLSLNHTVDDAAIDVISRTMPRLSYLNLEKTDITSGCAGSLSRLVELRTFDARRTAVGDGISIALICMPRLAHLMLAYTTISDNLAFTLAEMPALRTLKLTGCAAVSDAGIGRLCASPRLCDTLLGLDVGGGPISNAVAPQLAHLRCLESLQLWETSVTTTVAHRLAAALGLVMDDQIRCTKGTWIMLSQLRLHGRAAAAVPPPMSI
jgi:hypothetical protein